MIGVGTRSNVQLVVIRGQQLNSLLGDTRLKLYYQVPANEVVNAIPAVHTMKAQFYTTTASKTLHGHISDFP